MAVTKMFIIGSFTAPSTWIALITAFVVAYSAVRIRFGKRLADVFMDAVFYFIIVWKLGVVLTDFSLVVKSPLSIIYFHGGLVGFYLGLTAAGIRVLFEMKKNLTQKNIAVLFTGVVIVQAVYQVMMVFLNEGEFVVQLLTVSLFTLFTLFVWVNIEKSSVWPFQLALMFIVVHLFVASFQAEGLTGTPVIATLCIGLFFAVFLFRSRELEEHL